MRRYEPPAWVQAPQGTDDANEFALEQIKQAGGSVGMTGLNNKPYVVLGRERSSVDVVFEHPSVSREHAALEIMGERVFLHDLGSTHGTFLNGKWQPIQNHDSSGAIRVELRVGDCFKLGESHRMLFLHGPERLRPPEHVPRKAAPVEAQAQMHQSVQPLADTAELATFASWGQTDDPRGEADDEDGADNHGFSVTYKTITGELNNKEKQMKKTLEKKQKRKQQLEQEASRIESKDNKWEGGLTEEQQNRLSNCSSTIQSLELEIEELEEELNARINNRLGNERTSSGAKRKRGLYNAGADEEDDAFFDRSAHAEGRRKRNLTSNAQMLTLPELVQRKQNADGEVEAARVAVTEVQDALRNASEKPASNEDAEDALDTFMERLDSSVHRNELAKAEERLKRAEAERDEANKMLDVADPTGIYRQNVSKLHSQSQQQAEQQQQLQGNKTETRGRYDEHNDRAAEIPQKHNDLSLVSEKQSAPARSGNGEVDKRSDNELPFSEELHEGLHKKGSVDRVMLEYQNNQSREEHDMSRLGVAINEGGFDDRRSARASREQARAAAAAAEAQEDVQRVLAATQGIGAAIDEDEEHVVDDEAAAYDRGFKWQPPEGQQGDGRTWLNDTLGY